jgi:hypothetical protein
MMFLPFLITAGAYIAFRMSKYGGSKKITNKLDSSNLGVEGLVFASVLCVLMYVYRYYMGFEGMSTFGDKCPNGHKMVADPMNSQQTTCVPVGHQTESPAAGTKPKAK